MTEHPVWHEDEAFWEQVERLREVPEVDFDVSKPAVF